MMSSSAAEAATLTSLDDATRRLVRAAAAVAASDGATIRAALADAIGHVPVTWMEEMLLQTHLFAGFPRALNAMREWRRLTGTPPAPSEAVDPSAARAEGEATCAQVYGGMYERLRENIRGLHPALDEWMIAQGYGTVLSRPGLDLPRRELCIVAACAASGQDRQLHSHLHGSRNVGVSSEAIVSAIDALAGIVDAAHLDTARHLSARIAQG